MPKDNEPTQKHTLYFYEGDFDAIARLYPGVSVGWVIRNLVRKHLKDKNALPKKGVEIGQVEI
jgi:hypothetical protein